MHICLLEPFYTGSHRQWAEEFAQFSSHHVEIYSLPGSHWKWRMYGGAVTLARRLIHDWKSGKQIPDLILATDMLDLATFRGLLAQAGFVLPSVLYFHENQLTYPWSTTDADVPLQRDRHYAFTNFTSALAADAVCFNSAYHKESFLEALPIFLKAFPDFTEVKQVEEIRAKSQVLPLGMDLQKWDAYRENWQNQNPLLLWNHRWEYDKQPELYLKQLIQIKQKGIPFEVVLLGQIFPQMEKRLHPLLNELQANIRYMGYVKKVDQYAKWLWKADVLFVTSNQDFFGRSVVEALYTQCIPLLPNRLAYPEHIPQHLQSSYLYDADGLEKLSKILQHPSTDDLDAIRSHVGRYDWQKLISNYDQFFNRILAQGGSTFDTW